jgi:SOS-response transcriptional repressor LexA
MHPIQEKILKVAQKRDLAKLSLRQLGSLIGEKHPQKVKHHLDQLKKKRLLNVTTGKKIQKERKSIFGNKSLSLIEIPILGAANCGEAIAAAEEQLEGYLSVSPKILGVHKKKLFALRAVGDSMNQAKVKNEAIENGDYVIIDQEKVAPQDGDYVVSIINGCANVKRFKFNKEEQRVELHSESSRNYPPIFIHPDDVGDYLVNGVVVKVIKG